MYRNGQLDGVTTAKVTQSLPAADGLSEMVHLKKLVESQIHDFEIAQMTSPDGAHLLHNKAYNKVNEIPED